MSKQRQIEMLRQWQDEARQVGEFSAVRKFERAIGRIENRPPERRYHLRPKRLRGGMSHR